MFSEHLYRLSETDYCVNCFLIWELVIHLRLTADSLAMKEDENTGQRIVVRWDSKGPQHLQAIKGDNRGLLISVYKVMQRTADTLHSCNHI